MPVYEIKNPAPVPPEKAAPFREDLEPVETVKALARVKRFKREWRRAKERESPGKTKVSLTPEGERDVRSMVERANSDLQKHGVLIHLSLIRDDEGFYIDVYDCTDGKVCNIVRDILIDVDELPHLLRNLQKETGLIIDKIL